MDICRSNFLKRLNKQVEDLNTASQLTAAQQPASQGAASAGVPNIESSGAAGGDDDDDDIPALEAVEDEGPLDETGIEPKDIDLVVHQVGCSRAKAVKALRDSGGDLINASEPISFDSVTSQVLNSIF